MKYSKTEEDVISIVSKILNVKNIDLQSSQVNTPEWDSLAYLSVLSAVEEEFVIEISQENINSFSSVQKILNEIKNL